MMLNHKIPIKQFILQLFLSRVPSSVILKIATKFFDGTLADPSEFFLRLPDPLFRQQLRFSADVTDKILQACSNYDLSRMQIFDCEKIGVEIIDYCDSRYPAKLRWIYSPPPVLFVKGKLFWNDSWSLSVVGARNANDYGLGVLPRILGSLVGTSCIIVSGGAAGIDAAAHKFAISQNLLTVAVFGCGLDTYYPSSNFSLFNQILSSGGALVSPFPLKTPPDKKNFPIRNRIIAGVSEGTLVVQAAKNSGSLITAQFALSENREVFAVPGPVDSILSEGCHGLIKKGAVLTSSGQDIIEVFSLREDLKKYFINVSSTIDPTSFSQMNVESLDAKALILAATKEPLTLDQIAALTKLNEDELINILFEMEMFNLVVQNFNGTWQKKV